MNSCYHRNAPLVYAEVQEKSRKLKIMKIAASVFIALILVSLAFVGFLFAGVRFI